MEFTTGKTDLNARSCVYSTALEQPVDCDVTLPEYFPDLVRVLKCALMPSVTAVQCGGESVRAEGAAVLSVLYVSEGGALRCYEQRVPFSVRADCPGVAEGHVRADAKCAYVNCRVVSPRRMDVHGSLNLSVSVYEKTVRPLLCGCTGGGVQMQKKHICASGLAGLAEKLFSLGETLELGASKPSIAQLVRSEAVALLEDVKLVSGKALLKGELILRTLYLPDGDAARPERMEHSMPINQIIELAGAEPGCTVTAALDVCGVELAAKTDASGALRLLDARVSVSAHVALYAPLETDVVLDAYSTGFETKLRYTDTAFRTVCDGVRDTALCRGAPDLSGISVSEVLDLSCTDFSYAAKVENGELVLTGRAQLGILYADAEGAPGYVERGVDVAYRRAVTTGAGEMSCEAHAAVSGTGFVLTGDSQLDARVELDISATVFSGETLRLVEEVALDTQKPLSRTAAALTIYFADAGESVWEIARRYSTTVEAVKAENGLKSDVLDGDCKLLIPSV